MRTQNSTEILSRSLWWYSVWTPIPNSPVVSILSSTVLVYDRPHSHGYNPRHLRDPRIPQYKLFWEWDACTRSTGTWGRRIACRGSWTYWMPYPYLPNLCHITIPIPCHHLLTPYATGNMTTGTARSCRECARYCTLNFMRVSGDRRSSLMASTKSSYYQLDRAMSVGELP